MNIQLVKIVHIMIMLKRVSSRLRKTLGQISGISQHTYSTVCKQSEDRTACSVTATYKYSPVSVFCASHLNVFLLVAPFTVGGYVAAAMPQSPLF